MTLVSGKVWLVEKFAKCHPQKWCQMRGVWVFSTIFNQYVVISRKQCILRTKLLQDVNRKPYAGYRMVSLSMTLSDPWPGFQGHGSFKRRISRKRCILHTKLLWDGNRKPYEGYRMVSLSMTLSDAWPGFQGHGSFKRRVSPKRRILQTQLLYRT